MLLSNLLHVESGTMNPDITALCEDSRDAVAGALFFAQAGHKTDGTKFINDAIMRGCVAIAVPDDVDTTSVPPHIAIVHHKNLRILAAQCAAKMYPGQPDHIVAVTGTSGKTSTTYFVQQLLNACRHKSVSLGTLGLAGAINESSHLTTPQAPALHATLQRLKDARVHVVAMEASSQALAQHRMDCVRLSAAALTNLSRDHLDYHGDMDTYFAAKKRLFTELLPASGTAIINADDHTFEALRDALNARAIKTQTYGRNGSDFKLIDHTLDHHGQHLRITLYDKAYTIMLRMAGAFQAANVLCALALAHTVHDNIDDLVTATAYLYAPPGRLQPVPGHPKGAAIYVDYAHKPDALAAVLQGLRAHGPKRLICLFGCGGDRDAGKRPIMGEIAARLSDAVIVTDDNPRTEDAATIRAQIIAAAPKARNISDRRTAIQTAIAELQSGDILLIAGKGHESGQIFADHTDPFNDVAEAETAIRLLAA